MAYKEKQEQSFKLVSWPSPQDFQEAMQIPQLRLADPELKTGQPELDALGLPRPRSGNFASVYHLMLASTTHVAVRCFLNRVETDREKRYSEISKFIMNDDLPQTVTFQYQPQGIYTKGDWLPILKMEWVHGETLDEYIDQHLFDRPRMEKLLAEFQQMVIDLNRNGIAHGDLQHGNILVSEQGLRLVDYDGMYVPGLAGWNSLELGHRNYQHPKRTGAHFGPYLDNFSIAVIQTSLRCILIDPALWDLHKGGDECLLFRREDFENPADSATFAHLRGHSSQQIRHAVQELEQLIKKRPDEISLPSPMCDGQIDDMSLVQSVSAADPAAPRQRKYKRESESTPTEASTVHVSLGEEEPWYIQQARTGVSGSARSATSPLHTTGTSQGLTSPGSTPLVPPPLGRVISHNVMSALVYVPFFYLNLILPIYLLITEPKSNRVVRFHAWQGLFLTLSSAAAALVLGIFDIVKNNPAAGICYLLVMFGIFLLSIRAGFLAFKGKKFRIPIVGQIADRLP